MIVKKGVILAAGESTRMRPMTTSIPKPMLPLVDKPIIDYILEEAFTSGIEEVAIIVGYKSEIIKDYIDKKNDSRIILISQLNRTGTADAIALAKDFIGNEPFALYLGDEIVDCPIPCTKQLIDSFTKNDAYCITGLELTDSITIQEYNSVDFVFKNEKETIIKSIIEKPKSDFPSLYTSIGRYVIKPDIFDYYHRIDRFSENEFYFTEILSIVTKEQLVMGYLFDGKRYDLGNKKRWLEAFIELGQKNEREKS